MARRPPRYRRAATLACYWHADSFVVDNYRTRRRTPAHPAVIRVLSLFGEWRTVDAVVAELPAIDATTVARLVRALHRGGFLRRWGSGSPPPASELGPWERWAPEAPFFHFASRDVTFLPREVVRRAERAKARTDPPPHPVKRVRRVASVKLPAIALDASLVPTLLGRRTWRRFGRRAMGLEELGTLLGLTWGVQHWLDGGWLGRIPLKTAPSGGARHSLEVYVMVLAVQGLRPGWYHYRPDVHRLDRLARRVTRADVARYVPAQPGFRRASALCLMTSVIPRVEWRYPSSRAYRVVLMEAGHFCQTFCLVATALGLAPFSTAALADTRVEQAIGVDGVNEAALYVAGVGTRPHGVDWAPLADSPRVPRRTSPPWTKALTRGVAKP
jgi:SagB-type dehydrogenase family enzyme